MRTCWKEKSAALNLDRDGKKLWRLAKQLNDEDSRGQKLPWKIMGKH